MASKGISPPTPDDESRDTSINVRTSSEVSAPHMKKVTGRNRCNHMARPHRRRRSARLRASATFGDDQESSSSPGIELEISNLENGTGGKGSCPSSVPNRISLSPNSLVQDEFPLEDEPLPHFSPFQPVFTPADYDTSNINLTDEWGNIDQDFLSESFAWPEDNDTEDASFLSSEVD